MAMSVARLFKNETSHCAKHRFIDKAKRSGYFLHVRVSRLTSFIAALSLVFTAVVYACSGLSSLPSRSLSAAMDHNGMEGGPCNNHKQDICKFIRHEMISVQSSSPLTELAFQIWTIVQAADFDDPVLIKLLPATGPPGVVFHPVSKISYPFSNQVLRI